MNAMIRIPTTLTTRQMKRISPEHGNILDSQRSRFEGMKRVMQFNAGKYLAAASTIALAAGLSQQKRLPRAFRFLASAVGVFASYQSLASLIASHWVYDLSPLHHWRWLAEIVPGPTTILNVVAGYDETTEPVQRAFPNAELSVIDFYPDLNKREPSIQRAQKLFPATKTPIASQLTNWRVEDNSIELVLIAFAAHEVRDQESRDKLFAEASRVVSRNGSIVLVEHLRDKQNLLAYGPGFLHFLPEMEWLRCASAARLRVTKMFKITPFVGVFVLCH